nr:anthrone oxygenase family protein [uncultured Dongia sp.]
MLQNLVCHFAFIAALGAGLIAGAFFAFSNFVMRALGRLPAPHGIAAMQSIDIVVINPVFLGVFMGTAGVGALLAVLACLSWTTPGSAYLLAAGALYIVGTFLVTMIRNVPLNNELAAVAPDSSEGAALWTRYLSDWVFWNHVRTVAALLSCGGYILAISSLV